jgi:hypothetical protein
MFSLLNPWVIIGAICAVLGVYFYGHHQGYEQRVAEDQAEIVRLNEQARAKEADLNIKLMGVKSALRKATDDVKAKQSSLNARIDSGELRLPSNCPVQTSADAPTGDTTDAGQSERQAIKDIVSIVSEGDIAITQLNACIDTYNKVREAVNVKP